MLSHDISKCILQGPRIEWDRYVGVLAPRVANKKGREDKIQKSADLTPTIQHLQKRKLKFVRGYS